MFHIGRDDYCEAEIDGFDSLSNVKIIGCTNRIDILDPAIIRPGRLDRLIEVGKPDEEGIKQIFKTRICISF